MAPPGEPMLIVVGGVVPAGMPEGSYLLGINQRDQDGQLTGGLGIELNVRKGGEPAPKRRGAGK